MRISTSRKVMIGAALLAISVISSVFAATISINTQSRVEFGQGLYQVGACDNFVNITPTRVWSGDQSAFYVSYITIQGLDLKSCPQRYVRLRVYSASSPSTFVPIYRDSGTTLSRLLLYVNGSTSRFEGLDVLNRDGLRPPQNGLAYSNCPNGLFYDEEDDAATSSCKAFGALQVKYIRASGNYEIFFDDPLLVDWGGVTIETSKEVF